MKTRVFLRIFGTLLKLMGVLLLVPGAVAAFYREPTGVVAFFLTSIATLLAALACERLGVAEEMGTKEGLALVAFGWLGAAFFGALPYVFCGMGLVDALFESMSGFTTTGASILTESNAQGYWIINQTLADVSLASYLAQAADRSLTAAEGMLLNSTLLQSIHNATVGTPGLPIAGGGAIGLNATLGLAGRMALPEEPTYFGLLFWRSFSQWLGGMGIILLFIAILPKLGVAGRQLYKAEVPGPDKDALTPRIRQTAELLWWIYLLLSTAQVVLLVGAGMPLYDALCNMFAAMATGGFSPQAASIAAYKSALIDGIIVLFMFLAGANFALHYKTLYEDRTALIKDAEFRFYALIILLSTALIMIWGGLSGGILERFRYAIFQVVSVITTTGFVTADFDQWTPAARFVLILLMFVGACAGSTGGAIKVVRLLMVIKYGHRELLRALHPKIVSTVKLGSTPVRDDVLYPSIIFFALYILIFAVATLLLGAVSAGDPGMSMEALISAVATTLGNVGPGLGQVGPTLSFSEVHPAGKMLLFLCMWIGRLEIITPLVLLLPEFWKK